MAEETQASLLPRRRESRGRLWERLLLDPRLRGDDGKSAGGPDYG